MDKLKIVETVLKAVSLLISSIMYAIKFLIYIGKAQPKTA